MNHSTPRATARFIAAAACASLVVAAGWMPPAGAGDPAYRVQHTSAVTKGVQYSRIVRKDPSEVVNIAKISSKASVELRAVPAQDKVGDGRERTSAICRRVSCLVGINADFWKPGTDLPVGGVVSAGRLLRPPSEHHQQFTVTTDRVPRIGGLTFHATLVSDDLRRVDISGVNRAPKGNEIVVFTPAFGRSTRTSKGTIEVRVTAIRPKGLVGLDRTTVVRVAKRGSTSGDAAVPEDGAILAGRGRGGRLLRDLLARARSNATSSELLLRVESTPKALESIGGSPVLVRKGKAVPVAAANSFVIGRHPRTMIGWKRNGDVLLVTVDGRQPDHSEGMSLAEAARLMIDMGASEALNLDGGGSTTFVRRGDVLNRPSDRVVRTLRGRKVVDAAPDTPATIGHAERDIAIALMVIPKAKAKTQPRVAPSVLNELANDDDPSPGTTTQLTDPASDPTGTAPELVYRYSHRRWTLWATAIGSVAVGIGAAGAFTGYTHATRTTRRRRSRSP